MYLKAEEAEREMEAAAKLNPGPWVEHVRSAAAAGQKIAAVCGLNEEKAYSVILTHDIGRRFGRMGMRHVYLGWQYMTELGADENAQICLSHSFPDKDMENGFGDWQEAEEKQETRQRVMAMQYDDYDYLGQLCDCIALPTGVVLLEKRMVDVMLRHGVYAGMPRKWQAFFDIKKYFDARAEKNIYRLFPDIVQNTFEW